MACLSAFLLGREVGRPMAARGRGTLLFTGDISSTDTLLTLLPSPHHLTRSHGQSERILRSLGLQLGQDGQESAGPGITATELVWPVLNREVLII